MLLDLKKLVDTFKMDIRGAIHVGAHTLEEMGLYDDIGVPNTIWIEANPELVKNAYDKIPGLVGNTKHKLICATVSDQEDKEERLYITNNFASSSILSLGTHKEKHPSIHVEEILAVKTMTLSQIVKKFNVNMDKFNFLNLDIQGAELLALMGFKEHIKKIDYIYTEVNIDHLYKGCALLPEMDGFLKIHGFKRVETYVYTQKGWGDALYIREELL